MRPRHTEGLQGLGFRAWGLGSGLRLRDLGFGFRVQGLGLTVSRCSFTCL